MRFGKWLAVLVSVAALSLPAGMEARESHFEGGSEEIEEIPVQTEDTREHAWDESEPRADDWFTNPSNNEDYGSKIEDDSDERNEKKKEKQRFIEILRDDSFIYYIDRKTARFLNIPHVAKEKMIDVWIKLEPLEYAEGDYTYPAKFFLEHYLIRPKRQQIQFLAELEVTGRPSNETRNLKYDGRRWEELIPGSIEDSIYHAVMRHKSDIHDESTSDGTSIRDYIEDTLNISL